MFVIIDIGATSSKAVVFNRETTIGYYNWNGVNLTTNSEEHFLKNNIPIEIKASVQKVFLYAAGYKKKIHSTKIQDAAKLEFPGLTFLSINKDIDALAHCFRSNTNRYLGIILGTGMNAILVENNKIKDRIISGGYLINDFGSGYDIGQSIIRAYLIGLMTQKDATIFESQFNCNKSTLIPTLYSKRNPNKFMASFAIFLTQSSVPFRKKQLDDSFSKFFNQLAIQFPLDKGIICNFAGSIAYNYQIELLKVAEDSGYKVGKIIQNPLEEIKVKIQKNEIQN